MEVSIEQMNKAIAEFMKLDQDTQPFNYQNGRSRTVYLRDGYWLPLRKLKYHSSWDWLMPVVEKVQNLKEWREGQKELRLFSKITIDIEFDGCYRKSRCSIIGTITYCHNESIPHTYTEIPVPHIWVKDKNSALDAVYKAVYQFIQWYNKQKQ